MKVIIWIWLLLTSYLIRVTTNEILSKSLFQKDIWRLDIIALT